MVDLTVKGDDLKIWTEATEGWALVGGSYKFMLGFAAGGIRLSQSLEL